MHTQTLSHNLHGYNRLLGDFFIGKNYIKSVQTNIRQTNYLGHRGENINLQQWQRKNPTDSNIIVPQNNNT